MPGLNFGDEILDFLRNGNLLANRKEKLIEQMSKHFADYSIHTDAAIEQLIIVTNDNPQLIIDITKKFLTHKEMLSKIWSMGEAKVLKNVQPGELISKKAKAISSLYELAPLFSLVVHLLSKRKVLLRRDSEPKQIFKHLRGLGLTYQDSEDIRLIRNAASHVNSFDKDALIFGNKKVLISRIDELYYKLDNMMNWNMTLIVFSLFYIPKFGILVAFEILFHMDKFNLEWQQYFEGIKQFYKTELEELEREKQSNPVNKKPKSPRPPEEISIIDNEIKKIILENIDLIADRWSYHFTVIAKMLSEIKDKLMTANERQMFEKVSNWVILHGNLFADIRDKYKTNSQKYDLLLFGNKKFAANMKE